MVLIDPTNYSTANTMADLVVATNQSTQNYFWILFAIAFGFITFTVFALRVGTKFALTSALAMVNIANFLLLILGVTSIFVFASVFIISGAIAMFLVINQ